MYHQRRNNRRRLGNQSTLRRACKKRQRAIRVHQRRMGTLLVRRTYRYRRRKISYVCRKQRSYRVLALLVLIPTLVFGYRFTTANLADIMTSEKQCEESDCSSSSPNTISSSSDVIVEDEEAYTQSKPYKPIEFFTTTVTAVESTTTAVTQNSTNTSTVSTSQQIQQNTTSSSTTEVSNSSIATTSTTIENVNVSRDMNLSIRTGLSKKDFVTLVNNVKYFKGTAIQSNAGFIWECCKTYNVNEIFMLAVFAQESGWGKDKKHIATNNYGSMMHGGKLIQYASAQEGMEANIKHLGKNYLSKDGKFYNGPTLDGVKTKYCPTDPWTEGVYGCMLKILNFSK